MDSRLRNLDRLLWLPRTGKTSAPVVWHYTSRDGLEKILESHQVLGSDAETMNDQAELHTGHEAIADALTRAALPNDIAAGVERHLDFSREVMNRGMTFVLSASAHDDNVSLWERYSGLDGYAIGFKTSVGDLSLLEARPFEPGIEDQGIGDVNQYVSVWRDVLYSTAAQAAEADAFIDLMARLVDPVAYDPTLSGYDFNELVVRAHAPSAYAGIVTRLKSRSWDSENEVRITAVAPDADRFHSFIDGRTRVKLTGWTRPNAITGRSNYASAVPTPLPIAGVRSGPACPHSDLRGLLDASGYTSAEVHTSGIRHR